MTAAVATVAAGTVFGLALAAPPGPMNALIAEESALGGWIAGVAAGLGAMTADACFLALAYVGAVGVVARSSILRSVMVGAGGLLMLYLAAEAARGAASLQTAHALPERSGHRGFGRALTLALTNPYQVVFWLTIGVGLLQPGTLDVLAHVPVGGTARPDWLVVRTGSPALVVGLFAGIGVWILGFPAAIVLAGRRVDRVAPAVALGSALALAAFGGWFLLAALGRVLVLGVHLPDLLL